MQAIIEYSESSTSDLCPGRFPDTGAYESWVDLYQKVFDICVQYLNFVGPNADITVQIQAATQDGGFEARGSLAFISQWKPVLTNPVLQLAQESMTGWKEVQNYAFNLTIHSLISSRQVILATNYDPDVS